MRPAAVATAIATVVIAARNLDARARAQPQQMADRREALAKERMSPVAAAAGGGYERALSKLQLSSL